MVYISMYKINNGMVWYREKQMASKADQSTRSLNIYKRERL
jgi:hypothetical protein